MENPQAQSSAKVTVDEKVVRKMLAVNPAMRRGRTTQQVKRAFETGEGVDTKTETTPAQTTPASGAVVGSAGRELDDTIGFFVRGKADVLKAQLEELAARRKAIEAEEKQAKMTMREQMVAFLALLDGKEVDAHGPAALAKHAAFLAQLELTPTALLDQARKGRRK